jgi:hypothetical protein
MHCGHIREIQFQLAIIRIESILLKFHWSMKALIELHFQLPRFIENVLRSTLSYPNETSKECIQFLITPQYFSYIVVAS